MIKDSDGDFPKIRVPFKGAIRDLSGLGLRHSGLGLPKTRGTC